VGFKNKEGVEIQTGPLEFTAEEGSDCWHGNGSPIGAVWQVCRVQNN
jgi:hypothetical protein